MATKKIIIGGLPRSGSTLLRCILDASEKIISGPETAFFTRPLSDLLLRVDKLAPKIAEKLDLEANTVINCIEKSNSTVDAFDHMMREYMKLAGKEDVDAWAEKTPRNCFHYQRVMSESEYHDHIYFVSTIRNGLDCITSEFEKSDKRYTERRYWVPIQQYVDCMRAIYSFGDHARHLIVKYEDLCSDPKDVIKRLSCFLGLEITDTCLSNFNKQTLTRNFTKVHQPKLINDIQTTWINRWNAPEHVQIVAEFRANDAAMRFLKASGYESE